MAPSMREIEEQFKNQINFVVVDGSAEKNFDLVSGAEGRANKKTVPPHPRCSANRCRGASVPVPSIRPAEVGRRHPGFVAGRGVMCWRVNVDVNRHVSPYGSSGEASLLV